MGKFIKKIAVLSAVLILGCCIVELRADSDGRAVYEAAIFGNVDTVNKRLQEGFDINKGDVSLHGQTLLQYATQYLNRAMVESLLNNGADINAKDSSGKTALHYAAEVGYLPILAYLIARGANIDLPDNNGLTPLHWAAKQGHSEAANYLVAAGADINKQTVEHLSVLGVATDNVKDYLQWITDVIAALEGQALKTVAQLLKARLLTFDQYGDDAATTTAQNDIESLFTYFAFKKNMLLINRFYAALKYLNKEQLTVLDLDTATLPNLCRVMASSGINSTYWLKECFTWCKQNIFEAGQDTYERDIYALIKSLNRSEREKIENYYNSEVLPKQKLYQQVVPSSAKQKLSDINIKFKK